MKVCFSCKKEKTTSDFHKKKSRQDGLSPYCRSCTAAKVKANRIAKGLPVIGKRQTREERNQKALERYYRNRDKYLERRSQEYDIVIEIERASRLRNREKQRPAKNARQRVRNRIVQGGNYVILDKELRRIYNQACVACGTMENLSMDHIIPLARGGSHSVGNLMTLCRSCNASKSKKTIMEWRRAKNLVATKGEGGSNRTFRTS